MPKTTHKITSNVVGYAALQAVAYLNAFNEIRESCEHHTFNILTKDHNCYHGHTKTECNPILCPLKE